MTTDEREAMETGTERAVSHKIRTADPIGFQEAVETAVDRAVSHKIRTADPIGFQEAVETAVDRAVTRWLSKNAEEVVSAIADAVAKRGPNAGE